MRIGLSKQRFKFWWLSVIPIITVIVIIRLQPTFIAVAHKSANNTITALINQKVNETFLKYNSKSFYTQKDNAFINNISTINCLKADILTNLEKSFSLNEDMVVKIPLGSISGIYIFNGLGPDIPIKIVPHHIIKADFEDEFSEAGINFVKHTMYINISVDVGYRGFIMNEHETIITRIPIAENILSGNVPEYYGSNLGILDKS